MQRCRGQNAKVLKWYKTGFTTLLAGLCSMAQAVDYNFSGFADFTAGDVLAGSNHNAYNNYKCPCFVSNYEYGGIYQNHGWNASNESMVGIQLNAKVDDQLSGVVQVDGRGLDGYQTTMDWAYLSYNLNNQFTLQAGRKRLPLYMYSDYNYIGYAYPWIRPPVDLYGWEIYSYDGANLQYNNTFGDWALATNTWAGNDSIPNAPGLTNIYNGYPVDTSWRDILGTSVDFSNDYLHFRAVYMQNSVTQNLPNPGVAATQTLETPDTLLHASRQQVWGLAFNADYNNWMWKSEYNSVRRPEMGYIGNSYLTGAGYKLKQVTLMYTYSQYWEYTSAYTLYSQPQRDNTRSVVLRWDFHPSVCFKLEYDLVKDHSTSYNPNGTINTTTNPDWFVGNSRMIAASLDAVF